MRSGLVFINLVDFDTLYGHRNDVEGYAANLERFDERLGHVLSALRDSDLLDHHRRSRQRSDDAQHRSLARACPDSHRPARVSVPASNLGTRSTFADLGQTLAANFGVGPLAHGTSFLEDIVVEHS